MTTDFFMCSMLLLLLALSCSASHLRVKIAATDEWEASLAGHQMVSDRFDANEMIQAKQYDILDAEHGTYVLAIHARSFGSRTGGLRGVMAIIQQDGKDIDFTGSESQWYMTNDATLATIGWDSGVAFDTTGWSLVGETCPFMQELSELETQINSGTDVEASWVWENGCEGNDESDLWLRLVIDVTATSNERLIVIEEQSCTVIRADAREYKAFMDSTDYYELPDDQRPVCVNQWLQEYYEGEYTRWSSRIFCDSREDGVLCYVVDVNLLDERTASHDEPSVSSSVEVPWLKVVVIALVLTAAYRVSTKQKNTLLHLNYEKLAHENVV